MTTTSSTTPPPATATEVSPAGNNPPAAPADPDQGIAAPPATEVDPDADADADDDGGDDLAARNAEAARHRVRAREAAAQRDALAQRVTGYQRRAAEHIAAEMLAQPGDLWEYGGVDPGQFFSDTDELNEAELRAAIGALIEQRPGLAKLKPDLHRSWGQNSGGAHPPGGQTTAWSDVLRSR